MTRLHLPLRRTAVAGFATFMACGILTPALASDEGSEGGAGDGDVQIVNTETVQVYTDPTGEVKTKRVYEQLSFTGTGTVEVENPIETDGLRNLDGFGGWDVRDGEQVTELDVDGEKRLRSVSNYPGDLPLSVEVRYYLDGEEVEPGDVVGADGELEVVYTVTNTTAAEQELSFDDGAGGTVTKMVSVPIPIAGSLTVTTPPSFTDVRSEQANLAGDGRGGTKLSYTMTLFPPLGSDSAEFSYTATIADGVVPRTDISALPLDPLANPTFGKAAESYQSGAETGGRLAEGAGEIDANLLKIRDGGSDLLAGLIQLRDGSEQLKAGLADTAAPGARKLADGAGQLDDGLGDLDAGAHRLADGTDQLADGTGELRTGARQLSNGAGKLKGGTKRAAEGSKKLTDGLTQISGGLDQLAATTGLPAAKAGIAQLQNGMALISAGLGFAQNPNSLIGGLTTLKGDGSAATPGLVGAKAGVDANLAQGGSLDQLTQGLQYVRLAYCSQTVPVPTPGAPATCNDAIDQMLAGVNGAGGSRERLTTLSAGLGTAIEGTDKLLAGANQLAGGAKQVSAGLDQLAVGVTKAVDGVLQLSTGAKSAVVGSSTLTAGLGELDAGAGQLADGTDRLADGTVTLDDGAQRLDDGAGQLADGAGRAKDGAGQIADGAGRLADGLGDAADGSGRLAEGLGQAADGAPKLVDGAQRLSDEGTKKLQAAGEDTAQEYGELFATIEAGSERAQAEKMAYGAPEGAMGLTAYSFVIEGDDGESNRNLTRGLAGLAVLGAGVGVFALRRRVV